MIWLALALLGTAPAAELQHELTWALSVDGQPIGKREVTVKYAEGDVSLRRIIESWTEIDGTVGPMRVVFRQRMTAHATENEPASFHAVMETNGVPMEVQARFTPSAWWVSTNQGGRVRTVDMPVNRIDISTADLFDPETRYPLGRFDRVRILSAETGEVLVGEVTDLGTREFQAGEVKVPCHGYAWDAPMGRSEFWYSGEGFLVAYDMALLGFVLQARLTHPPPPGIDDFPVRYGAPAIEILPL